MKPVKDDWYKLCRIYLEFINPKERASVQEWEEYIEKSVQTAKSVGLNTLAFDPYYGGYAIHKGSAAPYNYDIGEADIFSMMERAVHKRGMKLVAFSMGMHFQPYTCRQYPSWVQRDSKGEPIRYTENWLVMCPNSPFGNYLIQDFGRLISQYPIDGIYIEGLYFADGACFCPYCREKFVNTYGFEMLSEEAEREPSQYTKFRESSLTDFVRRMRRMIDQKSPETIWMASPSAFGDDWAGMHSGAERPFEIDFASWGKYVDVIHMERQWGYPTTPTFPLRNIGQSVQIIRAETHKPVFRNT